MIAATLERAAEGTEVRVALITGIFALCASAVNGWFAYKAAKNSKPVSNGFTSHVRAELQYLRQQMDAHKDLHLSQGH